MTPLDPDRNLLFGVLALQLDFIDTQGLVEACTLWTARKQLLADVLAERGWITGDDRARLEWLLERSLNKQGGDARASLAAAASEAVRSSLAGLDDPEVKRSLASLPPVSGVVSGTAIGLLPASVALEIKNPLAFVASNLALLEQDCKGLLTLVDLYSEAQGRLAELAPDLAARAASLAEEMDLEYVRDNLGRLLAHTRDGVDRVTSIVHSLARPRPHR